MKKWVASIAALALLIALATAPATAEAGKKLTIWAGGSDNVNQQFLKQIEQFNKTNTEGYVAELQFITSGTGAQGLLDRVVAAKLAGQTGTDFDLIELGGDEVMQYVSEGGEDLFTKLDKTKIPNIQDLKFPATYRDDLVVPYRGTTVVLAYNSDVVPTPPKTAEELYQWIKDHPGRFAYNTPNSGGSGSSFVATAVYNFLPGEAMTSNDEKWTAEWDKGFDLLTRAAPLLLSVRRQDRLPQQEPGHAGPLGQQGSGHDPRLGGHGDLPDPPGRAACVHQDQPDRARLHRLHRVPGDPDHRQ